MFKPKAAFREAHLCNSQPPQPSGGPKVHHGPLVPYDELVPITLPRCHLQSNFGLAFMEDLLHEFHISSATDRY